MINVLLGMDMTILNQKFKAAYRKGADNQEFMFTPDTTVPKGAPLSIGDMVAQVNALVENFTGNKGDLTVDDVKGKLEDSSLQEGKVLPEPEPGKTILDYIVVNIDQAFVHLKKYDNGTTPSEMSYAFQFSITFTNNFLPDFSLFKINTVTFAIWNCNYQKVLDRMNIWDMSTYLQ